MASATIGPLVVPKHSRQVFLVGVFAIRPASPPINPHEQRKHGHVCVVLCSGVHTIMRQAWPKLVYVWCMEGVPVVNFPLGRSLLRPIRHLVFRLLVKMPEDVPMSLRKQHRHFAVGRFAESGALWLWLLCIYSPDCRPLAEGQNHQTAQKH